MSDSVWKKELSFRRKREPEPAETAESLRVKEIAFQAKLEEAAQVAAPVAPPVAASEPPAEPPVSVWKKEISLRRKSAKAEPATIELPGVPVQPAAATSGPAWEPARTIELQPVVESTPAEAPAAPPVSVWKKEIHLRRKTSDPVDAGEGPAEPPVSIWKKEISFRRKPDGDPHAAHRGDSIWTKDISLKRRAARNEQIRALAEQALRQVVEAEPPVEEWLAEPKLPPAPLDDEATVVEVDLEPEPVPVAPAPVSAAATFAVAAAVVAATDEPKVSFWKREIGKPKAKDPRAPKAPKAPKEPKKKKAPKEPKAEKPPKQKTRLRDVQVSLPRRTPKSGASGGHHPVKRLVGLKIGASQIAAARIANNGAAELLQVARQSLDQGVIVGGEVRDPEALAVALKQFFARNKLPRKNVRLGIASNRIGVRIFDLAGITDDKQLENAIRFRAQETLPIPLDEALLDYHVLGEGVDDEGAPTKRVLLVVTYRELVERYALACKKAGITLAGVDLEAFALLRALAAPRGDDTESDSALVAVSIGHDRSTFAVSDGRVCEFTRVIEWGGSTLSVAIARALDRAPSEVEGLKRLVSLESPAVPDGIEHEQYALAVDAVRRQVQAFARELVSSLQFYQHQQGSLGIGEIVITGGTAGLAGLANELQTLIGVRVRVGDPLARLKVSKKLSADGGIGSFAVAIGLGIED